MRTIIYAFLMALALNGSSSATDLLCPPSEHGPGTLEILFNHAPLPPLDQWKYQYFGGLSEISVMRFYGKRAGGSPKSIITCERYKGSMQMRSSKMCRIVEGKGHLGPISSGKDIETITCTFGPRSLEENNEHACMIVCE
jgi:hypothetical protein